MCPTVLEKLANTCQYIAFTNLLDVTFCKSKEVQSVVLFILEPFDFSCVTRAVHTQEKFEEIKRRIKIVCENHWSLYSSSESVDPVNARHLCVLNKIVVAIIKFQWGILDSAVLKLPIVNNWHLCM